MCAKICFLLLLVILAVASGQKDDQDNCKPITTECACGIGETKKFVTLELKVSAIKDSETGKVKCSGYPDPYQACGNISCVYTQTNSKSGINTKDFISSFDPKEFTIVRGDVVEGRRFVRHSGRCRVTGLKNAEVKCLKYPHSVTCTIKCVYGYGLRNQEGTVTSSIITCEHDENIWKPHGFYECLPYLNCKVQLKNPGKVKCVENEDRPAYCDISCAEYAQYDGVPLQRYECVDDNFGKDLPYCASIVDHVKLIEKPY